MAYTYRPPHGYSGYSPAPAYGGNRRARGGNRRARRGGNPSALANGWYQNRPVNPGIVAAGFEGLAIGAAAIMSGDGGAPPYFGYRNLPIFTGLVATEVEALAAGFFNY